MSTIENPKAIICMPRSASDEHPWCLVEMATEGNLVEERYASEQEATEALREVHPEGYTLVRFDRSPSTLDRFKLTADGLEFSEYVAVPHIDGPWVQFTYEALTLQDSREIAYFEAADRSSRYYGFWIAPSGLPASDLVIMEVQPARTA